MKKLILIFVCVGFGSVFAQTITPQVLNAAGGERTGGGMILHDNVGEPFASTVNGSGRLITQGFLQPDTVSLAGFSLSTTMQQPQCLDRPNEGYIALALNAPVSNYTASYVWSDPTVCPGNNCSTIDSLKPGVYSVTVTISYVTKGLLRTDTIRSNPITIDVVNAQPCIIKVFSGVTPNNDGINDVLIIDNIDLFPKARVTLYNRWGKMLADITGYDPKNRDKSWPTDSQKKDLVASTYFYVIELTPGAKPIKGWVELIKD